MGGWTTPPLTKKVGEGTLLAADRGVDCLCGPVGLTVAAATPMSEQGVVYLVVTALLNLAEPKTETAANVLFLHVRDRDAVSLLGHLLARVTARIGTSTGRCREGARTETLGKPNLLVRVFEKPLDDRPTVPRNMVVLDSLEEIFNYRQDILPCESIRQLCDECEKLQFIFNDRIKIIFRRLEDDLLDHALSELGLILIVVLHLNIFTQNVPGGLGETVMRPISLLQDNALTGSIPARHHVLFDLANVYVSQVSL